VKISERLKTVAGFVKKGAVLADVGTDHGYVPIYLAKAGRIKHAIAMDINPGPLSKAKEHIQNYRLEQIIETRQSDGMEKLLPGEVDHVLIAGMGGSLMARILDDGRSVIHHETFSRLVLSPQSEIFLVRQKLAKEYFQILEEHMIKEDGKYYTIIIAEPGVCDYADEIDFIFGKRLLESNEEIVGKYLSDKVEKLAQIRAELAREQSDVVIKRCAELDVEIEKYQEALRRYQANRKD